jgi:hypothetical protein
LQDADKKKDTTQLEKLKQIVSVLQQASTPPPELALVEELLGAADDASMNKLLEQHAAEITPEFSSMIASVLTRSEEQAGAKPSSDDAEMIKRLEKIYQAALKLSMKKSLQ